MPHRKYIFSRTSPFQSCWGRSDFFLSFHHSSVGWIPGLRIAITFLFRRILDIHAVESDSVNHADSGDIKLLVQFLGKTILKFSLRFRNCVGFVHIRGYFILKTTQYVQLFILVIFINIYMAQGVFIWFYVNPRNHNPRNFHFLAGLQLHFDGFSRNRSVSQPSISLNTIFRLNALFWMSFPEIDLLCPKIIKLTIGWVFQ